MNPFAKVVAHEREARDAIQSPETPASSVARAEHHELEARILWRETTDHAIETRSTLGTSAATTTGTGGGTTALGGSGRERSSRVRWSWLVACTAAQLRALLVPLFGAVAADPPVALVLIDAIAGAAAPPRPAVSVRTVAG